MTDEEFYGLSGKDVWQTPSEITDTLGEYIPITLDPCAGLFTFIGEENWTIDGAANEPVPSGVTEVSSDGTPYERTFVDTSNNTLRCGANSLEIPWDTGGVAFVNPPFSLKNEFIDKTLAEIADGNIDGAVVLTSDGTDVKSWWHEKIVPNAPVTWFSKGRINFINPDTGEEENNPTFGTALHFVGPRDMWPDDLFDELNTWGDVVVRWTNE